MPEYYCPDDCELQKECSLKHPLPGDRFTSNPSNKIYWCYVRPLGPITDSRTEDEKEAEAGSIHNFDSLYTT